jgi:hypothetical protein
MILVIPFDKNKVPEFMKKYHPSTSRWILFYDFLKRKDKFRIIYKRVWMIDLRDSFFQKDPFEFINPDTTVLHVFNGVESKTISQCGWNSGWIKDCFTSPILEQVGSNKIICSGVVAGTMDVAWEYISIMKEILSGRPLNKEIMNNYLSLSNIQPKFPTCERNGVDQGAHNVVIYKNYLNSLFAESSNNIPSISASTSVVKQWSQSNTPVCNMQGKVCIVKGSSKNNIQVINPKGDTVHVVHQYDRFPELQKALFAKVYFFFFYSFHQSINVFLSLLVLLSLWIG